MGSEFLGDLVPGRPRSSRPAPGDERLPVVGWLAVRCPACDSTKPRTTGRNGRRRYHTCSSCGARFLSHELRTADELLDWFRNQVR